MIRLGDLVRFVIAVPAVMAGNNLDLIDLPIGFQPEGVTLGHEQTVFVSAFTGENTGQHPAAAAVEGIVVYANSRPVHSS